MGGKDHTVPEAITKSTLKQYKHSYAVTELLEFEDRGHSLTIDRGWREVATMPRLAREAGAARRRLTLVAMAAGWTASR